MDAMNTSQAEHAPADKLSATEAAAAVGLSLPKFLALRIAPAGTDEPRRPYWLKADIEHAAGVHR